MRRGKLGPLPTLLLDHLVTLNSLGSIPLKSLQLPKSGEILAPWSAHERASKRCSCPARSIA